MTKCIFGLYGHGSSTLTTTLTCVQTSVNRVTFGCTCCCYSCCVCPIALLVNVVGCCCFHVCRNGMQFFSILAIFVERCGVNHRARTYICICKFSGYCIGGIVYIATFAYCGYCAVCKISIPLCCTLYRFIKVTCCANGFRFGLSTTFTSTCVCSVTLFGTSWIGYITFVPTVTKCWDCGLCHKNLTTNSTVRTFGKTCCCTCCWNCRDCLYCVTFCVQTGRCCAKFFVTYCTVDGFHLRASCCTCWFYLFRNKYFAFGVAFCWNYCLRYNNFVTS